MFRHKTYGALRRGSGAGGGEWWLSQLRFRRLDYFHFGGFVGVAYMHALKKQYY